MLEYKANTNKNMSLPFCFLTALYREAKSNPIQYPPWDKHGTNIAVTLAQKYNKRWKSLQVGPCWQLKLCENRVSLFCKLASMWDQLYKVSVYVLNETSLVRVFGVHSFSLHTVFSQSCTSTDLWQTWSCKIIFQIDKHNLCNSRNNSRWIIKWFVSCH